MAKTKQVTKEFSIGQNTYQAGVVKSFSDEIAAKYESSLVDVKPKVTRKKKIEE